MSGRKSTGGSDPPPAKKAAMASSTSSPLFTSTPKKVSAEWYRDYEKKSFVHDTSHEFEATKIHTQSYDHRIGHIRGSLTNYKFHSQN